MTPFQPFLAPAPSVPPAGHSVRPALLLPDGLLMIAGAFDDGARAAAFADTVRRTFPGARYLGTVYGWPAAASYDPVSGIWR